MKKPAPFSNCPCSPFPLPEATRRWGEPIAALVARDRWHRYLPAGDVGASFRERGGGRETKNASCRSRMVWGSRVWGDLVFWGNSCSMYRMIEYLRAAVEIRKSRYAGARIVANRSAIILAPAYRPFFEFLGCSRTFRGWLLDPLWWSYVPKLDAPSATVYLFPLTSKTLLLSSL